MATSSARSTPHKLPVALPAGSPKLTLKLAYALLDHITDHGLAAGARLPSVKTLSAHFGVSIPSVREALVALETLGHVDLVHGVGTVVRKTSPAATSRDDDMIAVLEARRLLEGTVAAEAARRASGDGLRDLASTLRGKSTASAPDAGNWIRDFHIGLGRMTGNGAVMLSVDRLWHPDTSGANVDSLWGRALRLNLSAWVTSHRRIVDAIRRTSPVLAEDAMNAFSDRAMADVFLALEQRDIEKAEQAIAGKRHQFVARRLSA